MVVSREWWMGKRKDLGDGPVENVTGEGTESRYTGFFRSSKDKNLREAAGTAPEPR